MDGESDGITQPESIAAQNFAADLDSMFGLDTSSVAVLSQNIEQKKAVVSSGQSELEQLEAKLRETEQRLAKVSRQNSPSRQADSGATSSYTSSAAQKQASPLAQKPTYPDDRPPTAKRPQSSKAETEARVQDMRGAMPDSQGQINGRDDYVMVEGESSR